uniref:Mitogen-activated protein kinase n=1 Tax=Rhabditophanes sp. KR3021 TaxID=114890 RepID=A0AC35TLU8_9BILA
MNNSILGMSEDVDSHIRDKYELQKRLGKGAYGIVFKAIDLKTKEVVALKKIFDAFRNQTDAQRTFREVMFLQEFGRHPNIVKLYNLLKADNNKDIYLVFEYMEADLHNVIKKGTILKDIHKQYIMCQLFRAIRFLHSGNVLHRDLKPSNILLDTDCRVKLADFGLARSLSQLEEYPEGNSVPELTEYVATRWYRSPEILLAAKRYTKGVDMWSLGCILGEMLYGKALFPGTSTINQIEKIMYTIPKPSKSDVDSIGSHYAASVLDKMPVKPRKTLDSMFFGCDPNAIDLVHRILTFAPHRRLNVEQCLVHPYVISFHNPADEPALNYEVSLHLPDHIQLSIDEYRTQLYDLIETKQMDRHKIIHNNIVPPYEYINKPNSDERNNRTPKYSQEYEGHYHDGNKVVVVESPPKRIPKPVNYMNNVSNVNNRGKHFEPIIKKQIENTSSYYVQEPTYYNHQQQQPKQQQVNGYGNKVEYIQRSQSNGKIKQNNYDNSKRNGYEYDVGESEERTAELLRAYQKLYNKPKIEINEREQIDRNSNYQNGYKKHEHLNGGVPLKSSQSSYSVQHNNGYSKQAPIAQAECSDTDYDSNRSAGLKTAQRHIYNKEEMTPKAHQYVNKGPSKQEGNTSDYIQKRFGRIGNVMERIIKDRAYSADSKRHELAAQQNEKQQSNDDEEKKIRKKSSDKSGVGGFFASMRAVSTNTINQPSPAETPILKKGSKKNGGHLAVEPHTYSPQ